MGSETILKFALLLQIVLAIAGLLIVAYRRSIREFPTFYALLLLFATNSSTSLVALFYRSALHLPRLAAYRLYYWSSWAAELISFVLTLSIIYSIFAEAMRPFPGLQRVGSIIFRWVGVVSLAVSVALAAGPELFLKGNSPMAIVQDLLSRLSQGVNVLILCLLIFVCFAIRPLGLTFRSRVFGLTLGLGILATVQLTQVAWTALFGMRSLYSPVFAFGILGSCVALSVWFTYFAMPQPKRKMILLPTTSPFFFWNRISEILGDAPGNVAVAGFTPDMLAEGEIEMLTAATAETVTEREESGEMGAWHEFDTTTVSALPQFAKAIQPSLALSR